MKDRETGKTDKRRADTEDVYKRLSNLMWTVSGDYGLKEEVDVSAFEFSEAAALYDAVRQGAFNRFFDAGMLNRYLKKKILHGAEPTVLLPISRMCKDGAVWKKAAAERAGVPDIRRRAFQEILEKEQARLTHTDWGALEACYLKFCLTGERADMRKQKFVERICALEGAADTAEVIRCLDGVYEEAYSKGFADRFEKGLEEMRETSGQEEDGREEERTVNLLSEQTEEEADGKSKRNRPDIVVLEDESMEHLEDYVELNYGKSYLPREEQRRLSRQMCSGAHSGCRLHFTDGLLASAVRESSQTQFARRIKEENIQVMRANWPVTKQNIRALTEVLKRAMAARNEKETFASEYGVIRADRLWKLERTADRRLFERELVQTAADFVVEVLIDASGSQQGRQSMVALQGYIISEALCAAEIPCRVMGFCTFGDYTVLRRFRDYDEGADANERIFEFFGSSNNRDGLAIRASADSLMKRKEEHKILIVLSDGTPNDIIVSKSKSKRFKPYCLDYAVQDTAAEVHSLRNKGITVLGIFAGEEEAGQTERRIFGNEFAYIRKIADFSNVVGRYLKGQLSD